MRTALVLFTRDLRVYDQPALAQAVAVAERVVPLFVLDEAILGSRFASPNRTAFLSRSLRDLDASLRERGGGLVVRRGEVVAETIRVAREVDAAAVYVSADVSGYAQRREAELDRACAGERIELHACPGVTVVPPGDLVPAGGDHFRVFTPYWRRWRDAPRRTALDSPERVVLPDGLDRGMVASERLRSGDVLPGLPEGGERVARERVRAWARKGLGAYEERHDDLPGDATSRLSPYLHFGCLSPLELEATLSDRTGAEPFLRQLCWRDFYHQLLAANPRITREDYRTQHDTWRDDAEGLERWQAGLTGYPIVDAGTRQLAAEGWMHNRARLLTASFLVKDLGIDWRFGAAHFFDLLVDGDVASNVGNWQWVAGTGTDTRPNRVFNPISQAKRFDPDGDYVRRYVPELAAIDGPAVHEPWKLGPLERRALDYPEPILDHDAAAAAFLARRRGSPDQPGGDT